MAAVTKLSTISNALVLLGDEPLESFDGSPGATAGQLHFDRTFESLLAWHPWSFCGAKKELNLLQATPLNVYAHAFQLPGDFIRLRRTYPTTLDFEIMEDKLLANVTEIAIDYTFKCALQRAPEYFLAYLEMSLAAKICMAVTENATLAKALYEQAFVMGQLARSTDSQGRSQRPPQVNPFIQARG